MKNFTRILISSLLLVLAMAFNASSQDVFKVAPVGIGTTTPQQALDVAGSIKFSGALMPGGIAGLTGNIFVSGGGAPTYPSPTWTSNGANGYVLGISSGVPTWVTPFGNAWMITGNTISTTYGVNFLGTTNTTGNEPLEFKANNAYVGVIDPTYSNIYLGGGSPGTGNDATTLAPSASYNIGIGWASLATVGTGSSAGGSNNYATAVGYYALHTNNNYAAATASVGNTAIGYYAAELLTTGYPVTAYGSRSISNATTGSYVTAFGYYSSGGSNITTATKDISLGDEALYNLTTGTNNTAAGYYSLYTNSTGSNNTAVGYQSLYNNNGAGAIGNTAAGTQALYSNTTGYYNIGIGYYAAHGITTAANSIGIGYEADYSSAGSGRNVAIGMYAIEANGNNSSNVAVGTRAAYEINTLDPENATYKPIVAIGDSAFYNAGESGQAVAIGYEAMRGFSGTTITNDVAVGYGAMSGYASSIAPTYSTIIGAQADFRSGTALSYTTVIGAGALESTQGGNEDIAIGAGAMGSTNSSYVNSGAYNIAIGSTTGVVLNPANSLILAGSTLGYLSSGADNLAIGYNAGGATTTGSLNTYIGINSGSASIGGSDNTLIGANTNLSALGSNSNNTLIGDSASNYGSLLTSAADYNTAIGADATVGISLTSTASDYYNVAIGYKSNASPVSPGTNVVNSSVAIGFEAQAIAANSIAIGASAYANTANTAILGSISGVNGASSNVSVGINIVSPAQELETGGISNTIRIDGLSSGGSANFNKQISTSTGNILYANSSGDLFALPNGTTGQQLILNSNGVPTWGAASFSLTATAPLTGNGYSTPILLSGTTGGVVTGIGVSPGTGSAFTAAGSIDSILGFSSLTASVAFVNNSSPVVTGPDDLWGHQVAETDSSSLIGENTISGNGTTAPSPNGSPLRLAWQNATNGEVLAWNSAANTWKPATVLSTLGAQNITNGTAIAISNGTSQVIGSTNINVDLQGTAGGVLTGQGASSAIFSAVGTAGYALTSNGTSTPTWQPLNVPLPWNITGNSGITDGTNFLGTLDDKQLRFYVGGASYTGYAGSLDPQYVAGVAVANTYLGAPISTTTNGAGAVDLGSYNVGIGVSAMGYAAATASYNVALGTRALQGSTTSATTGSYNTAIGALSMYDNSLGVSYETAIGAYTLGGVSSATAALYNTAIGYFSMYGADANSVYFGTHNSALGYKSLYTPTAGLGTSNTAQGSNAAYQSTGSRNTAVGDSALYTNASGINNTALGYNANVSTAALTNANAIGANAYAAQSNSLVLGQINGINGATANTSVAIGTNTPKVDAALALKTTHIETQGQLGGGNVYAGPGAGTGATTTVSSATDMGGTISLTTGSSGLAAGAQLTILFATPYTYPPIITIAPANQYASAAMTTNGAYAATAATSFSIYFTTAPAANTTYTFNYFIIETPGTLTSNIPCCVPITLSNSQTTATPQGFQQQLTVDFASYASMELSGLTNVEFSTLPNGGGTPLYAWIENGGSTMPATAPTTSSTAAIVWVNLAANTIPAESGSTPGTLTIYMDFMPSAVMTGPTSYTGEAPEISSTYGQYDNGAYVFGAHAYVPTFYDNFAGTSLDANWVSYTSGSGGTLTINNGLTLNSASGSTSTQIINSISAFAPPFIAETDAGNCSAVEGSTRSYMPGLVSVQGATEGVNISDGGDAAETKDPIYSYVCWGNGRDEVAEYTWLQGILTGPSPYADYGAYTTAPAAGYSIWGLAYNPTANAMYLNYTKVVTGNATFSPSGNLYYTLGLYNGGATSSEYFSAYWARIRQYPPSATMPTAAYGSTSCANSQPAEPNPCSVALTVTNNQSTATSTGFQQLVQINSSTYSSLEMSGLQNVEFSTGPDGTGTQLSSWLESGNTSSSANTVYWVNLGSNIIPANGTLTIYMDFMPTSILSAGPAPCAGEAPQLSSTYAQYDNGGIVFPNVYTRWGGLVGQTSPNNLPTTTNGDAVTGGNFSSVGNDFTITNNATSTTLTYNSTANIADGVFYTTTPLSAYTYPTVLESDVTIYDNYSWFGTGTGDEEEGDGVIVGYDSGYTPSYYIVKSHWNVSPEYEFETNVPISTSPNVWSILIGGNTSLTSIMSNYTQVTGATFPYTVLATPPVTYYGYFGTTQNGGNTTQTMYWTRTRTYPPNGTMPSVSTAIISCCPTPPSLGAISGTVTAFCPGQTATYSVPAYVGSIPFTSYVWSVPTGSTITSGQGGTTITVTFGALGGNITVQTTNSCNALGAASTWAVTPDFAITAQPTNQSSTCATSSDATFSVTATGTNTYQWQVNTGSGWSNITTGGGIYSGYTTNTLTVSGPPFTMNGYQYQCIITGSCGGTITSNAVTLTVLGSIPITITNSQSTATPANFPQMIEVNSATPLYAAQEMSGLQNVEFSTEPGGTGTLLQAWIESGNSNTSTNTIYWVNLASNTIPAGGNITIYMTFASASVLSATGPTGEAPQLSGTTTPTYGEYDNGANIFVYYVNFAGTSLPSSLVELTQNAGGSYAVNNGLTISGAGNNENEIYSTTTYNNAQNILEADASDGSALGSNANDRFITWNQTNTGATTALYLAGGYYLTSDGCIGSSYPIITSGISGNNIWSLWDNSGLATGTYNYTTSATAAYTCSGNYYICLETDNYADYYQYLRLRTAPPSGVMPSPSLGALTCCPIPATLSSISGSSSFCPGTTGNVYSVATEAGVTNYIWTVPTGSTITAGQGTNSITVTFGSTVGNVSVAPESACGAIGAATTLPVTPDYGISVQPTNESSSCFSGSNAVFSVTTSGTITSYQWQVDSTGAWSNITGSRNDVYSGYTTGTLTVASPPFVMNGFQYRCVITGTCGGSETSNAVTLTVLGTVPIVLSNSQTTATPANFQQQITVNSASPALAAQEMSGLQNVEFSTSPGGSGLLQAWIESGNSNTSTNTIYWVNLGSNTIPAGGNLTIYMTFTSASVLSSAGPTGEAPQLSGTTTPTYGEYDNGPLVFTFYDNFAGTTLNTTNWNSYISGSGTTVVNNGLTITSSTGGVQENVISSNTSFGSIIAEAYESTSAQPSGGERSYMPGLISNTATVEAGVMDDDKEPACPTTSYLCFSNGRASETWYSWLQGWNCYVGTNNGADYNQFEITSTAALPLTIWSLVYSNSTSVYNQLLENYVHECNGTLVYNPTGNMYLALGVQDDGQSTVTTLSAYWARTRQYPPSATMPGVNVETSDLTCCPSPPALGGISGSSTFCPGTTGNIYSVAAVAGVSSYLWTVPTGSTITAGQNSTSITVTFGSTNGNITVSSVSSCGTVSTASTLAVTPAYAITVQPVSASSSCLSGDNAVFTVTTSGTVATYQWQVDSTVSTTNIWYNITGSRNGVYSGYTTDQLTLSSPPFVMNGYEYRCVITGTSCTGSITSNAVTLTVLGSIQITLTNAQSTATPANFAQKITFNSSSYTSQEMSGLQNVEFSTGPGGTGTLLQAWIESGNTNTSTSTVYWVNLGSNTIAGGSGTLTIYMDFTLSSVLSAAGPTGEAPQLSGLTTPTYGEYDNGALVFTFYDNYAGSTLNASKWTTYGSVTVNNGLSISQPGSSNEANEISSYGTFTGSFVAETYATGSSPVGGARSYMPGLSMVNGAGEAGYIGDQNTTHNSFSYSNGMNGSVTWAQIQGDATVNVENQISSPPSGYVISGLTYTGSTDTWSLNYTSNVNSTTSDAPTGSLYFDLAIGNYGGSSSLSSYWSRIRQYPPSNTMPTVGLGTLGCCASPPSLGGGISGSSSFCPGSTGNIYSVATVAGVYSYQWTVPAGSTITAGQGTTSITVTFGSTSGNVSVAPENACGTVGTAVTLAVAPSYTITTQPVSTSTSCSTGNTVTFSVAASPGGSISGYQWQVSTNGGTTWTNLVDGGYYSGSLTSTLTITSPAISMSGYEYQCVLTGACGGTATSSAATLTVLGNVPITLTNSQSTATSTGFQQQVTINSSTYASQELSGLQNVEFSVNGPIGSGGTALQSWLESGNTSASTNTVYWVNLGSNIVPASGSGTLTIYMNFMPTSVMSTTGPAGEAPDISPTYAEYDNGGLVFPNVYTRWGGLSSGALPTTVNGDAVNGGAITSIGQMTAPTINNFGTYTQVYFNSGSGSTTYPGNENGVYYSTTPPSAYTYPTVLESKVNIACGYSWFGTGWGDEEEGNGCIVAYDNGFYPGTTYCFKSNWNTAGTDYEALTSTTINTSNPTVWSMLLGSSSVVTNIFANYNTVTPLTSLSNENSTFPGNFVGTYQSGETLYGYFGTTQNGSTTPYENIYWTRTRTYPPSGVMPTAAPSGLTCCSAPAGAGTITSLPGTTSYCPGATATYSISSVAGASSYVWTVPSGSTITSGQGSTSINVTLGNTGGNVTAAAANSCLETGTASTYAVTPIFAITSQPTSQIISPTGTGSFTITTTGTVTYQWEVSINSGSTWSPVSAGGVYSISSTSTTSTLTLTDPATGMTGYEYECIVTGSCGPETSSAATLIVCTMESVPITITNNQSTATPTGLQEMLTINFTGYGSAVPALNPTLNNVEFTTASEGGGTPLYAWIENGNSADYPAVAATSSSTTAVVWVNLGSITIPANSSVIIYMNFESSTVMTGTTGYTGEAPQLTGTTSPTYGEYDNGSYVFGANAYVQGVYDNFAGNTLNASNWTYYSETSGSPTTPSTFVINNGLTITNAWEAATNTTTTTNVISSLNSYAPPLIAETYEAFSPAPYPNDATRSYSPGLVSVNATTQGQNIADMVFGNSGLVTPNPYPYICFSNGRSFGDYAWLEGTPTSPSPYTQYDEPGNNQYYGIPNTTYNIWSILYTGSTTQYNNILYDYGVISGTSTDNYLTYNPTGSMYYSLGMAEGGATGLNTMATYWTRSRQYPPSATLPGFTVGVYGCY